MISAATAAIAVLIVPLVRDHGLDYLFAAIILIGMIQIIAGFLRLNVPMQYVSRSIVTGFVNARAILILMAQLPELIGVPMLAYATDGWRPRDHSPVFLFDHGGAFTAGRNRQLSRRNRHQRDRARWKYLCHRPPIDRTWRVVPSNRRKFCCVGR